MMAAAITNTAYYDGDSQGGIIGGVLAAVPPDVRRAVLGVTGMDYGNLLLARSTDFTSFSQLLGIYYPDRSMYPVTLDLIDVLDELTPASARCWRSWPRVLAYWVCHQRTRRRKWIRPATKVFRGYAPAGSLWAYDRARSISSRFRVGIPDWAASARASSSAPAPPSRAPNA
jgi:hypothetical protein